MSDIIHGWRESTRPCCDRVTKMKHKPYASEHDRFSSFLERLLAVPHSEIKEKLAAEKKARKAHLAEIQRHVLALAGLLDAALERAETLPEQSRHPK